MPTKPKASTLVANGVEILNAIRNSASLDYQNRVPVATQATIAETGAAINEFVATQNEFLNALVNRIARVIITSKMYENPLKNFKKGMLEYGETVEELFVNIAKAHPFNPQVAEKEVFKREIPDVSSAFHKRNLRNFYKATISDEELRAAFLSPDGVTDLIARIVDSMYSGAEVDEFIIMKELISLAANEGRMFPVTVPAPTEANAKSIVTAIKAMSNKLEFPSTAYNSMGVVNFAKKDRQVLIVDAAFDAIMDVNVLASAFNMDKAQFMGRRVLIDDFSNITGAVAALVDEDWFMVFDNMQRFTEIYNSEGLYWNYFYHVWKTFSVSPFSNAILFTTTDVQATNVTLTPNGSINVAKGATVQFTAKVTGNSPLVPQGVTYKVEGAQSSQTRVDWDGTLLVAPDEASTQLTVTATSTFNTAITSAATTVTVA